MLEGLEIREIKFDSVINNKDFRVDSDFYTKEPKKNKSLKYIKIGDCLTNSQYGISISMNENNVGYPIYRMNEIHDMLCDLDVDKHAEISTTEFGKFELKNRDVLFNRTNSFEWVGRTGIYYQNDNAKRTFASYLVRFNPDENIVIAEYLATYLSSKYGVWDIKRRARQSINQTNVNPEEVKEIEIPIINRQIQETIKSNFELANNKRIIANKLYSEAEDILLEELRLKDWKAVEKSVSVKSFLDFAGSGRLDAEYYQPQYDEIEAKIKAYKGGYDTIENCFGIKDENYTPENNNDYQYIELSNIGGNGEITGCTSEKGVDLPSRARRIVSTSDIVVSSIEGSLQSCAIITNEYNRALCSTGFYVLAPQKINSQTSLLLFKSYPIQQIMKKVCSGTILTAMNKDEFLNIPIPIIKQEIQTLIAEKIQESFALKAESKRLLDLAKTAVETAIEQGEDTALELLNN